MTKIFVRQGSKEVLNLIANDKHFEALRVLRHKYSNYDRVWKLFPASEYERVLEELKDAAVMAYPELAAVIVCWKA